MALKKSELYSSLWQSCEELVKLLSASSRPPKGPTMPNNSPFSTLLAPLSIQQGFGSQLTGGGATE